MKVDHFLKNTLKYCIPSIVSAVIGIAVIPIVSRIYPADDYGKINLFYSVGNMMLSVFLIGLDSAYIRFYYEGYKNIKRGELFSLSFWTAVFLDVIFCAVGIFIFPELVGKFLFGEKNVGLTLAMGIYVVGLLLFRLLSIDTRMNQKAWMYNLQQVSLMLTNRVSFVFAAIYTTNYQTSILVITFTTLLFALCFAVMVKKPGDFHWKRVPAESYRAVMCFAIPLMPTTVMTWLNNSVSKMILSQYHDFAGVGILSIATSVANIFSVIPTAFCTYWSPFMYKNYNTEKSFIRKAHNYICVLSICIVWCIYIFQDILYVIVDNEYGKSQPYFMLIMLAPIQSLLCETTSYGIILKNKTQYNLYISVLAVFANILISYALYPLFGSLSSALGIAAAALLQLTLKTIIGQYYYSSIETPVKTMLGIALLLILITSNLFAWHNYYLRIAIAIVVALCSFLIYRQEFQESTTYLCKLTTQLKRRP